MKIQLLTTIILFCLSLSSFGQQNENYKMPLIGDSTPEFKAQSTQGDISFPDNYFGKWKIIFSHPADFTPVCTTEILELAAMQDEFKELNTEIFVISTDRINSHIQWVKSIESINYQNRGLVKINFPLISDPDLEICKKFGMIHPNSNPNKTIRAVYIINTDEKISAIFYYPFNVGRNFEEIKRTLIALQLSEKKEVLIPANWNPGNDVLMPSPKTIDEADKLKEKNKPELYSLAWYLWFMKM